jgi:putative FmdB family regulatory protein
MVQTVAAQMPIYAYKCSSCGHTKDALQKFSDAPLTDCPVCAKSTFTKQLTAPGFQLKGSGWYVTDFRDGKKPSGDAKTDASATDTKADAKTETKTETKTDAKTETAAATPAASPSTTPAPAASTPAPAAAAPAK